MRLKVLVADDNKLARMLIASALQRLRPEWELVEAPGADDALHAIITGTVDIALVDFNMPGTNGLELIAKIRESYPTMPIAMVTANLQEETIARARELNVAFVPKPLAHAALEAFLSGAALQVRRVRR
jgi:CheY-like chemotaxis protein